MANPEHVAILNDGAEQWNQWLASLSTRIVGGLEHPLVDIDLTEASFDGKDLSGVRLIGAELSGASFIDCNLSGADFRSATLNRSNLSDATLDRSFWQGAVGEYADFSGADFRLATFTNCYFGNSAFVRSFFRESNLRNMRLSSSDLTASDFIDVSLTSCDLENAIVTDSQMGWTSFSNVNLKGAHGLETVNHVGPSTIGIDTLHRTGIGIPESFLLGAGVPDTFVEYYRSLIGKPIEFYSCFISYSTKDQEFAERIHNDLQAKSVRCWFAPHDLKAGQKLYEQIDEAIRLHEKLLLILSPDSMNSEWVRTEISKARKREIKEDRRVLFPIRLVDFKTLRDWECFDADAGKDSAREIREYYIPDFSGWKSDADEYQREFAKLLRDLRTV